MKSSLNMVIEHAEGVWCITAPWLHESVYGETFYEAYWAAMKGK